MTRRPSCSQNTHSAGHESELENVQLALVGACCADYLAATISRSSMSNTNVAPGLIRGGRPLSR